MVKEEEGQGRCPDPFVSTSFGGRMGTQAPEDDSHNHRSSGGRLPEGQQPQHYRSIDPSISEKPNLGQTLLKHPVLENTTRLGDLVPLMGNDGSLAPDPPWFAKPPAPMAPSVHGVDREGNSFELQYIRYALMDDEPMLLGTTGKDQEVFGEPLRAFPAPPVPFITHI